MTQEELDKYFLAAIVESSNDSIITVNFDAIITTWNKAAELLYGYPRREAIGKNLTMLTLDEDFDEVRSNIDKVRHNKKIVMFQTERIGKEGNRLILEVVMSPVKDHKSRIVGVSTIARDITERNRAEKLLNEKQNLQRLIEAQEDERKRIARDLHDELGQQLIALKMQLEAAKNLCQDDELCEKIEQVQGTADNIDKGVDFLAWELRPATLDDFGLATAIENYVRQWSEHSGIKARFLNSSPKRMRLTPNMETHLYRIVQESLNNIHKHAGAENAEVLLDKRDGLIVLVVEDDGKGFNQKDKKQLSQGIGLTGMKERAALMGGTLEIESAAGKGTTVFVRIQGSAVQKRRAKNK